MTSAKPRPLQAEREDPQGPPTARAIGRLIAHLKARYEDCLTGELVIPAREAIDTEFPSSLDGRLVGALRGRGIQRLYCHQLEAWESIGSGRHTVIVTPTASGKTLCYNLPVLQAVLEVNAKALYLFPTKALSQDQVAELAALNQTAALGVRSFTYDGDTPSDTRRAVRTGADIVVTNPDMLHQAILPHHTKWAQFFKSLKFVVIDELHTYRGVFGAHVANVLRRLRRIGRFYGVAPVFIFCSATIANPAQLASRLIGDEVRTIAGSGAPQGARHVLLWNPPVVNHELGIRASARSQTARIARLAVDRRLKTIVFAQSRLLVEVLTKYLKDALDGDPRRPPRVRAYRGGYLPSERRATERELREGLVDCVVATNALELGVDIGALDVCVLNGYPGTIAGTWQRLGRAGRRRHESLGVLVANSSPLDQYLVSHPDFFLGASPEHARIDPDQLLILFDHIRCAAFELPFKDGEQFGGADRRELLEYLQEAQVLHHEGNTWHWMTDSYPANSVSLRSVAEGNFLVIDITRGKKDVIAEVDYSSAALTLYEGAIYMMQARPWQVEQLDWIGRKAMVRETQADYYTTAIDYTRLKILECFEEAQNLHGRCVEGEVHLVRRVAGYKKVRYYTHENVGYGPVNLPDQEMHTTAVWWPIAAQVLDERFASRGQALEGLLGAAHALHFVAALLSMSEPRDLGRAVGNGDGSWSAGVQDDQRRIRGGLEQPTDLDGLGPRFNPSIFIYDNYPGGIGLAAPLFELRNKVIDKAAELVADCPCQHGCPACIGPILNPGTGASSHSPKQAALAILALLSQTEVPRR
nr:DEAD/DEAH box helicase [Gammaproteobacteria bacterium]